MCSQSLDCCRLCSTQENLISMFGGKSRTIRNFLRKMIQETVNVQVEQNDSVPSVCFNCLVDISNFHYFKLHCLENQKKLKDVLSTLSPKPKKCKLYSEPLEVLESPNIDSTEEVLKWLTSKRMNLLKTQTLSTSYTDRISQTFCEIVEVSTQCDRVVSTSKSSQTATVKINEWSKTTQTEMSGNIIYKKDISDAFTQYEEANEMQSNVVERIDFTNNISKTAHAESGSKQDKSEKTALRRTRSQYFRPNNKVYNMKNSYSQTKPKTLCQKLFLNYVIPEISTQDHGIQTKIPELVDKDLQCDLIHVLDRNSYKVGQQSNELDSNKPVDLSDKMSQTDTPKLASVSTQCELFNILNEFYCKELCFLSPTSEIRSKNEDSKLIKEEKLSPMESLTISTNPRKNDIYSPSSSDLLQVKPNKSHCVEICTICDKSLYNRKEIVMHNKTHLQCHFCKKKFRSLKATQNHINACKLKQTNLSPYIELARIDKIPHIKKEYADAFLNRS